MELGSDGALGGMGVLPLGRVSLSLKSPQTPEEGVLPGGTRSHGAGWRGGGCLGSGPQPGVHALRRPLETVPQPCLHLWQEEPIRPSGKTSRGPPSWSMPMSAPPSPPTSLPGETPPCGPTPRALHEAGWRCPWGGRTQADLVPECPPLSLPFST